MHHFCYAKQHSFKIMYNDNLFIILVVQGHTKWVDHSLKTLHDLTHQELMPDGNNINKDKSLIAIKMTKPRNTIYYSISRFTRI